MDESCSTQSFHTINSKFNNIQRKYHAKLRHCFVVVHNPLLVDPINWYFYLVVMALKLGQMTVEVVVQMTVVAEVVEQMIVVVEVVRQTIAVAEVVGQMIVGVVGKIVVEELVEHI